MTNSNGLANGETRANEQTILPWQAVASGDREAKTALSEIQ
jgi:hypothetical protein